MLNLKHNHIPGRRKSIFILKAQHALCFCHALPFSLINTPRMTHRRKHQSGTVSSLQDKIQCCLQSKVLLPHFIAVLISTGSPGHLVSVSSRFLQMECPSQLPTGQAAVPSPHLLTYVWKVGGFLCIPWFMSDICTIKAIGWPCVFQHSSALRDLSLS